MTEKTTIPLRVRVATEVLGFHVETVTPEWYRGREVLLFFRPGSPLVEYSWDEKSCNAVMFRNGVDEKDGNAPSLPNYHDDANEALEVVASLVERGFYVTATTHPKKGDTSPWEVVSLNYTTGVEVVGFGDTFAEAVCESALLAVNSNDTSSQSVVSQPLNSEKPSP